MTLLFMCFIPFLKPYGELTLIVAGLTGKRILSLLEYFNHTIAAPIKPKIAAARTSLILQIVVVPFCIPPIKNVHSVRIRCEHERKVND